MHPVLILQSRPEDEASDNEFEAILAKAGLGADQVRRIRLDQTPNLDGVTLADISGVIVGGGPACVSDSSTDKSIVDQGVETALMGFLPKLIESDFPYLGCCYGIGILAHALGAVVSKERHGDAVGAVDCRVTVDGRCDPLLEGVPDTFRAFVGHKEAVQALPGGCVWLVESTPCPFQMIRYGTNVYACQFHPEADSEGFEVRIRLYQNKGYFPPEQAEALIAMCRAESVEFASHVLQNFVSLCAARESCRSMGAG